jgi:DeoR/GlpR family transcriptional regulator of sugar metabolism
MNMLVQVRRSKILDILRAEQTVKVKDLKKEFDVSAMTINRDLKGLESEGLVKCVHGGAVLPHQILNELLFSKRVVKNADLKQAIARIAIECISSDMSIFLDGSTTAVSLARLVKSIPGLSIVTDSLSIFFELQRTSGIEVNILGGVLQGDENTVGGPIAQKNVTEMHFDLCFFSAACYDNEGAYNLFSTGVEVKQIAIKRSKNAILLADSTKYGRKGVWSLCNWDNIRFIVTDQKISETFTKQMQTRNCEVITAPINSALLK